MAHRVMVVDGAKTQGAGRQAATFVLEERSEFLVHLLGLTQQPPLELAGEHPEPPPVAQGRRVGNREVFGLVTTFGHQDGRGTLVGADSVA